jgi:hypothetical protein
MTESEARRICARLAREHPERETNQWFARAAGEDWTVVKVPLPEGLTRGRLTPTIETKPRPPQAEDPRSAHQRNAGEWSGLG